MNGVPGYAGSVVNPALVMAIESTRQYLRGAVSDNATAAGPVGAKEFPGWPGNTLPQVDDPDQLLNWQPDCRASVLAFEAMSGLSFVATPAGPAGKERTGGELRVWGVRKDGQPEFVKLIGMSRPKVKVLKQQAARVAERMPDRLRPKSDDLASRDRLAEITAQVVPPLAFWCATMPIHPDRMPRTLELIDLALLLASFAVQRFKHALAVARPHQIDAQVVPAILTPGHASLPSGHATEAYAVANLLVSLIGPPKADDASFNTDSGGKLLSTAALERRLFALAARIADNREVAGLHYPIDTQAGRLLGTVLSDYLVARCTGTGCRSANFNGADLHVVPDKVGQALAGLDNKPLSDHDIPPGAVQAGPPIERSAALAWVWNRARQEWGAPAYKST